jgi:hypothetical protein
MNGRVALALMPLLTLAISCGRASEPAAVTPADPVQILRQMSDRLAQASQLTFTATRQLDSALSEDSDVPESAEIEVAISRPGKVQATATAKSGVRRFYFDGQNIALLDEAMLLYAIVPLPGTIDDMIDKLDETYGFVPPLADFAANDPYRRFSKQIQSSVYHSKETINGVECDYVTVTGEVADADVWVSSTDHLPRRFVATFKDREGKPQLRIDFSQWNLTAKLDDSLFVLNPPKGAEKITMLALADVKAGEATDGSTHK